MSDIVCSVSIAGPHGLMADGSQQAFGTVALDGSVSSYNDAWIERHGLLVKWAAFSEQYPLVVAPIGGMPTPLLDLNHLLDAEATTALFNSMRSVPWVNLYGLPALALPNCLQLGGRRFREDQIFAAARAIEPGLPQHLMIQVCSQ